MVSSELDASGKSSGPVVWEVRGHATGLDGGPPAFGMAGAGTMAPNEEGALKGRAVWLMGRRVGEIPADSDAAQAQS